MANWLEEELQNRALLSRREQEIEESLKTFYDLCVRVNHVMPTSLTIHRLKVAGKSVMHESGQRWDPIIKHRQRGIHISCLNQDEILIDAVATENSIETVLVRKKCALQDLSNWPEDQMLLAIQWMMWKSDGIKDSIPGTTEIDLQLELERERQIIKKKTALQQDKWRAEGRCEICGEKLGILDKLINSIRCKRHREI